MEGCVLRIFRPRVAFCAKALCFACKGLAQKHTRPKLEESIRLFARGARNERAFEVLHPTFTSMLYSLFAVILCLEPHPLHISIGPHPLHEKKQKQMTSIRCFFATEGVLLTQNHRKPVAFAWRGGCSWAQW